MRGQAGAVLHGVMAAGIAAIVLLGVLLAIAAWRLSQGPVDVSWLIPRIEASINATSNGTRLGIGSASLAWEGFRLGVDRPLDLRLRDVTITGQGGGQSLSIPRAEVSLSLRALLLGQFRPRAVEIQGLQLVLHRAADGSINLAWGSGTAQPRAAPPPDGGAEQPLAPMLAQLAARPASDRARAQRWFSQLHRVRIEDAAITVLDSRLGAIWYAPHAAIDLNRPRAGGLIGDLNLTLAFGAQDATLKAAVNVSPNATATHLSASLTPIRPTAVARTASRLGALSVLDAPAGLNAALDLGPNLEVRHLRAAVGIGAGAIALGNGELPIQTASIVISGTPSLLRVEQAAITLPVPPGDPVPTLAVSGIIRRADGKADIGLTATLDHVAFADLARLWPAGIGGGARPWITENITGGIAHDGRVELGLSVNEQSGDVTLNHAQGTLDAQGLVAHWLRPVPPIEQGNAQLRILDPDTMEIVVRSGHQVAGKAGLALKGGTVRISGITQPDQIAAIQAEVTGTLPDTLALLKEPRLHLLDRHPVDFRDVAGEVAATVSVSLPLDANVSMDDIGIAADAHLDHVHLGAIAAGLDLDKGVFDLTANADTMTVKGSGALAGIASQIDVSMDFRAGPPSQVVQRVVLSASPGAGQLAAAGLDSGGTVLGIFPLSAILTERRNGEGELAVSADLTPASLVVNELGWRKSAGVPARAVARVMLLHDRLRAIQDISVTGDGLTVQGAAEVRDGQVSALHLNRIILGKTEAQAEVRIPPDNAPIYANISGATLDLAPKLTARSEPAQKTEEEPAPGPAWTADAKFGRVLLANGGTAARVAAHAENDGRIFTALRVEGDTGKAAFSLNLARDGTVRRLNLQAADAGTLLRGLDLVRTMDGGKMTVTGSFDDSKLQHPLSGIADIDNFRIREATALGKLLQAMTLYGLADVMRGPGLGFSRLIAPFTLANNRLELRDARAFSPSLGLTAKGVIDLKAQRADVQGTIVPAYFFNSLLGNLPLVGKLFSPERGGGVFAASYQIHGPLEDPAVSVNPLTALTPGFLRGLFGLF